MKNDIPSVDLTALKKAFNAFHKITVALYESPDLAENESIVKEHEQRRDELLKLVENAFAILPEELEELKDISHTAGMEFSDFLQICKDIISEN